MARSTNTTEIIAAGMEKPNESSHSGINIEEAKKFLGKISLFNFSISSFFFNLNNFKEQEQEYDKKLYKDRIKRMHRVFKLN